MALLPPRHEPRAAGFTLVEVCIAMGVIAIAAVGIAPLLTVAARAIQTARLDTSAAVLASQKLEQLRALRWTVASDGSSVSDCATNLAAEPAAGGGRGLCASAANTLETNTAGYVDYLNARGEWVGTGSSPPSSARFIRRWSVQPLPDDPANALTLEVRVTAVEHDALARPPGRRLPGDALVATVMTRRLP